MLQDDAPNFIIARVVEAHGPPHKGDQTIEIREAASLLRFPELDAGINPAVTDDLEGLLPGGARRPLEIPEVFPERTFQGPIARNWSAAGPT